jgi:hypothetical protein
MLRELEDIVENEGAAEDDMRHAAKALLERQFVFADDHRGQRRYDLVRKHAGYFTDLFDAMGYDLFVDEHEQVVGVLERSGVSLRRMTIHETLFLFGLRAIYSERVKEYDIRALGRCETTMNEVWTLVEERTGRTRPAATRCRNLLDGVARNGIARDTGPLPDGDTRIEVRPVITKVITSDSAEALERYRFVGGGSDEDEAPDANEEGTEQ